MPCNISSSAAEYAASVPTAANGKKALGFVNPSATLPIACKGLCPAKGVPNMLDAASPKFSGLVILVKEGVVVKKFIDASVPALVAASNCPAVASATVVPAFSKDSVNAVVFFDKTELSLSDCIKSREALKILKLSFSFGLNLGSFSNDPVSYTHLTLPTKRIV